MATEMTPLLGELSHKQRFVPVLAPIQQRYTAMLAYTWQHFTSILASMQQHCTTAMGFMQRHWVAVLVAIFSVAVAVVQLFIQTTLPHSLKEVHTNTRITITSFNPRISENVIEWAWVHVTNDLDVWFHDVLFGVSLTKKQSEALRNVTSLNDGLQNSIKILVLGLSMVLTFCQVMDGFSALLTCSGMIGANVMLKVWGGKLKAVDEYLGNAADRNKS